MTMLPSLQLRPLSTSHYYLSGDVVIDAGVAIAPGVMIQADPQTKVIIHSGVVIGSGTVIHANHGSIEIGAGAIIGAEVLLVGNIQIGEQACIGAASTIFHRPALIGKVALQIGAGDLIPPGALLGDTSRKAESAPHATPGMTDGATVTDGATANSSVPSAAAMGAPMGTAAHNAPRNGSATSYSNPGYSNPGYPNPGVNGQSGNAAPPADVSLQGQTGFAASATHGFVGVPQTESTSEAGTAPFSAGNSYFQAPTSRQPDLPCQPFTETPLPSIGTPPPPTRVAPQPSYPGPFTMPKADVPSPVPVSPEHSPESDSTAIQPSTNGAGTVNYVNQMLGRMFPTVGTTRKPD